MVTLMTFTLVAAVTLFRGTEMNDNPELVLMAIVITIMVLIFAIVWFIFLVPMERGLHQRRMQLIQKKLQQNEERLRQKTGNAGSGSRDGSDVDNASTG
jgi:hypothetical protein